jgi:hypothetical protein
MLSFHPGIRGGLGLAFACALGLSSTAHAAGLNDTGITFCADATTNTASCAAVAGDAAAFPRQDARFGRDAQAAAGKLVKVGAGGKGFDYSKIANNGALLPATAALGSAATDWACTRDNVTGLIWEVKTTTGLRSQSYNYSWYNSNAATNGGAVGTVSGSWAVCLTGGRCDTEKFTADVNAVGLCGASDWRMPGVKELESLVDFGRFAPSIDPSYFPNTPPSSIFWSGSPDAYSPVINAWIAVFDEGSFSSTNMGFPFQVRLVRTGQ